MSPATNITFFTLTEVGMIQGLNGIIYYLLHTHYFLPLLEPCVHFLTSSYFHISFTLAVPTEFECF